MKKIGIIIALALIVTIGGVYATWNYTIAASGAVDSQTATTGVTLTAIDTTTLENGTIKIESNSITIQLDDDNNDHKAELVIEGELVVSFTNDNNDSIALTCTSSGSGFSKYQEKDIFTLDKTMTSESQIGNGTQWTITGEMLKEIIQLNGDIVADTSTQYDTLATALENGTITLTFNAVGASTQGN